MLYFNERLRNLRFFSALSFPLGSTIRSRRRIFKHLKVGLWTLNYSASTQRRAAKPCDSSSSRDYRARLIEYNKHFWGNQELLNFQNSFLDWRFTLWILTKAFMIFFVLPITNRRYLRITQRFKTIGVLTFTCFSFGLRNLHYF